MEKETPTKLTNYQQILKSLVELSDKTKAEQEKNTGKLFAKAKFLVNNDNINELYVQYNYDNEIKINHALIVIASYYGNLKLMNYLLDKYLDKMKEKPENLIHAILSATVNDNLKPLKLLLSNAQIVDTVIKKCHADDIGLSVKGTAYFGRLKSLKLFLSNQYFSKALIANSSKDIIEEIKNAADNGNLEILKLLLTIDMRTTFFSQFQDSVGWNAVLNDIAAKHGRNSDIYKIIALYVDVTTKNKDDITIKRLEEMIKLAYNHDLYTMLIAIKDKCKPTAALISEAIAEAKQEPKPIQNSEIIKNICKYILLQDKYQWKADNCMIYGNIIDFLAANKFDPYNPITESQIDQIKHAIKNLETINRFLTVIQDALESAFKNKSQPLNDITQRFNALDVALRISRGTQREMFNKSNYTDIMFTFSR